MKCRDCFADLSSGWKACPHCGARISDGPDPAASTGAAASKSQPLWAQALAGLLGAVVVGSCVSNAFGPAEPERFDNVDAMGRCIHAVKRFAKDPEKAQVPWVDAVETADAFEFRWTQQTRLLRLRNGLGLEVAVGGRCTVSKTSQAVRSLVVDGQTVF
jgi:hypothetical protein